MNKWEILAFIGYWGGLVALVAAFVVLGYIILAGLIH